MENRYFITALNRPVDCDLDQRILRGAVLLTTGLASDGALVLPSGVDLKRYTKNAVITDRHTMDDSGHSQECIVIGNAMGLEQSDLEITALIKFPDTQAGRDFAHLYGVNAKKEAFMRAFSVELPMIDTRPITFEEARKISAMYWDASLAERMARKVSSVVLVTRSEIKSVAAVPVGADRGALTRAEKDGCITAGAVLARLDLDQADKTIEALRMEQAAQGSRLQKLEEDVLALRRDGPAAAARGDTAEVLARLHELTQIAAQNK
jgi:hypothetical protein